MGSQETERPQEPLIGSVQKVKASLDERHAGEQVRYTQCFLNGCMAGNCLAKWHIDKNGKAIAITADDTVNAGNAREDLPGAIDTGMIQQRPCVMGTGYISDIYNPDRITYPMKRVGERGAGKWERISYEEAADTIAKNLMEIRDEYGPQSILADQPAFQACTFPLAPWFKAGFAGWGSISFGGPDTALEAWAGYDIVKLSFEPGSLASLHKSPQDFFNSKLIVLWGWNAFARNYGMQPYYLKLARERGIPIISIDPMDNWTDEVLADQHIAIRPGTDLAMLLAIADVLITEDLYDHDYVEKWIEPIGFEKLKDYILGKEDGEEKTPEWAESKCGVPKETIREFARLYAKTKPTALELAVSCGRQHRGEYPHAMAIILQAMTGNTAVPGGSVGGGGEMGTELPFPVPPLPDLHFNRAPEEYEIPVTFSAQLWMDAILLRDELDSGKITLAEYNQAIGAPADAEAPNIQCIMYQTNTINNAFDVNKRIQALKKVKFSFGWHYSLDQVVTNYLDIILPAAYPMETTDDYYLRRLMGPVSPFTFAGYGFGNSLSYQAKVVDPPGDIRAREWFWVQVANRCGIGEKYNGRMQNVAWKDWESTVESIHKEAYEEFAANPLNIAAYGRELPSWEEFLSKPLLRVPFTDPHYPFKEAMEAGVSPFHSPSGKIEPYASLAEKVRPETKWGGYLDPLPRWEVSYMDGPPLNSFLHPKAADYPLALVTPVSEYRQHSLHDNNPMLRDECYRHAIWISVADANARSIKDGDLVRVHNDIAEMYLPAYVTGRMTPGVASIFHGAWYTRDGITSELMPEGIDRRGACNLLVQDEYGPHNKSAFLTTGLVEVAKA